MVLEQTRLPPYMWDIILIAKLAPLGDQASHREKNQYIYAPISDSITGMKYGLLWILLRKAQNPDHSRDCDVVKVCSREATAMSAMPLS